MYRRNRKGFIEEEIIEKEQNNMGMSQNLRIIPMVEQGIMKQNYLWSDTERLYQVRKGN